jgi:D-sedoheptulose 7-phosphate isomerase
MLAKFASELKKAGKIWLAGDGGSAALADHFACDLIKNCHLPAISLCANSAVITAIANDYSFEDVFYRQLMVLFQPGDLLVIFSTSGNSPNLVKAAKLIRNVIVFSGNTKGKIISETKMVFLVKGTQMEMEDEMLKICHEVVTTIGIRDE